MKHEKLQRVSSFVFILYLVKHDFDKSRFISWISCHPWLWRLRCVPFCPSSRFWRYHLAWFASSMYCKRLSKACYVVSWHNAIWSVQNRSMMCAANGKKRKKNHITSCWITMRIFDRRYRQNSFSVFCNSSSFGCQTAIPICFTGSSLYAWCTHKKLSIN